jgi:hypothetical protein
MPAQQQAVDVGYYNFRPMKFVILLTIALSANISYGQVKKNILHLVHDTINDKYGYLNKKGDTIVPFGKYSFCFTTKFDKFAIVSLPDKGFIGIDRNENILFNIFVFDNGPDYLSDGLFRIVKNGKIGYADKNGNIIIFPKYDCAYPFVKGKANVGTGCEIKNEGEHWLWTGGVWHFINKKGQLLHD